MSSSFDTIGAVIAVAVTLAAIAFLLVVIVATVSLIVWCGLDASCELDGMRALPLMRF